MKPRFSYDQNSLDSLKTALSQPRLDKYLIYSNGDLEKALEIHVWNTVLGASLHSPIQNFELLLRNQCCNQLESHFGNSAWYAAFPSTDKKYSYLNREISKSKRKLTQAGRDPNYAPAVVASLMFGFWVALFEKALHRDLWTTSLYKAFPYRPHKYNRAEVWHTLQEIRNIRNRIAHHEPIFNKPLGTLHQLLIDTASYMCPDTAKWIEHQSNFHKVWSDQPKLSPQAQYELGYARIFS